MNTNYSAIKQAPETISNIHFCESFLLNHFIKFVCLIEKQECNYGNNVSLINISPTASLADEITTMMM